MNSGTTSLNLNPANLNPNAWALHRQSVVLGVERSTRSVCMVILLTVERDIFTAIMSCWGLD